MGAPSAAPPCIALPHTTSPSLALCRPALQCPTLPHTAITTPAPPCSALHRTAPAAALTRSPSRPNRLNWKAYWGSRREATIIHWHGPKPRRGNCIECFLTYGRRPGWEKNQECAKCDPIYVGMVNSANATDGGAMYERMLQRFEGLMWRAGGAAEEA